jgi:hypothetical protein
LSKLSKLSKLTRRHRATIFVAEDVMPQVQKSKSTRSRTLKASDKLAKGPVKRAYALTFSAAKQFVVEPPPPGVRLALFATTGAAEKRLEKRLREQAKAEVKIESSAFEPSSRARALLQGVKIAEADLRETGGAFDLDQVRTLLHGVSRQALEKRVREGSLLAVPGPSNRRRYPAIQFTREGVVPGLKEVQAALPTRNPWAVLNFLIRPDDRLGGRKPIEALGEGDADLVVSAARCLGVQGG